MKVNMLFAVNLCNTRRLRENKAVSIFTQAIMNNVTTALDFNDISQNHCYVLAFSNINIFTFITNHFCRFYSNNCNIFDSQNH